MITSAPPPVVGRTNDDAMRTTAGAVAVGNLQAQIDGLLRESTTGRLTVRGRAGLVDLVTLRGHLLGRIADLQWAGSMAERLVEDAPTDGDALLARARTLAAFHRFADALADLDQAGELGADPASLDAERASIFSAVGRYEEALAILQDAVTRRADFHSLADLATLHAECGDVDAAEAAFTRSRMLYRGASPIPIAQLDLARAHLWIRQADLPRARSWLDDAVRRLPAYAPGQGHLAEVEAASGETDSAITRLLPLTESSDDPDYAAQLARILREVGRADEADVWRDRAARRYEDLVVRHLEAYADHAAEFWLEVGDEPSRALRLALKNLEVRPTARARELVSRAVLARDRTAPHPQLTA